MRVAVIARALTSAKGEETPNIVFPPGGGHNDYNLKEISFTAVYVEDKFLAWIRTLGESAFLGEGGKAKDAEAKKGERRRSLVGGSDKRRNKGEEKMKEGRGAEKASPLCFLPLWHTPLPFHEMTKKGKGRNGRSVPRYIFLGDGSEEEEVDQKRTARYSFPPGEPGSWQSSPPWEKLFETTGRKGEGLQRFPLLPSRPLHPVRNVSRECPL